MPSPPKRVDEAFVAGDVDAHPSAQVRPALARSPTGYLAENAAQFTDAVGDTLDAATVEEPVATTSSGTKRLICSMTKKVQKKASTARSGMNSAVMQGSALSQSKPVQAMIYSVAFAGVAFVFAAQAMHLGAKDYESHGDAVNEPHRRLGGGASPLLVHIAFSVLGAGLIALMVYALNQPLILGYLLGGVLVGPVGLKIVKSHEEITALSSLGLIFLLFMVGLELNVLELLKMGRLVLCTGAFQFPLCAGIQICTFMGLQAAGLNFGQGDYATLYCGVACAVSSTMIVCKTLSEMNDSSSPPGRLTRGILIFQDIWAIIVLAIQPNMANPEVLGILKTFAFIVGLIAVAMLYAKFVMPVVLFYASKNLELMLVLALTWCFFICCIAVLPFIDLGMELASLIAGVAMATFPYSAEFNGKIKNIRDFFITLFFVSLGMQIPVPTPEAIFMGVLIAVVVLIFRWLGIYSIVRMLRGPADLATLATVNLSQISEFALVICSLGVSYGHIQADTLAMIIWTFALLAIMSSYTIGNNRVIYRYLSRTLTRILGHQAEADSNSTERHEVDRDIVLLGFHRIAGSLIADFANYRPDLLARTHIIDCNTEIAKVMKDTSVKVSYADIGEAEVLEHTHHGMPKLVISTIPDSLLKGINNMQLLRTMREVWPHAKHVVTADTRRSASKMYALGASYVLRLEQLCATKLHNLIVQAADIGEDDHDATNLMFEGERSSDMNFKRGSTHLLSAV